MPCYDDRSSAGYAIEEARARFRHNSDVAQMLCKVMETIHPEDIIELGKRIPDLAVWWKEHQARDKARGNS